MNVIRGTQSNQNMPIITLDTMPTMNKTMVRAGLRELTPTITNVISKANVTNSPVVPHILYLSLKLTLSMSMT